VMAGGKQRPSFRRSPTGRAPSSSRRFFLAYPLIGAVAYTFGGLATNAKAEVLGGDGPLAGLYAAGEMTGHFYGNGPECGCDSARASCFGRIAWALRPFPISQRGIDRNMRSQRKSTCTGRNATLAVNHNASRQTWREKAQ